MLKLVPFEVYRDQPHTHTYTYVRTYAPTPNNTYAYINNITHAPTPIHTIHTIHTYVHTYVCTYTHTYTCNHMHQHLMHMRKGETLERPAVKISELIHRYLYGCVAVKWLHIWHDSI